MQRPNILWFCTDQQRADSLACCGHPRQRSPNLDRIAAGGTRFARHLTPMQICSPSRASMATGLYPRHHALITNGRALPESVPTLMTLLGDAGYRTHGIGKQHLQPLLASPEMRMPDSRAFWREPGNADWRGPFYGYQTVDLLLGEADTAQLAGHYADWLEREHPQFVDHLKPDLAASPPPADLDEIWASAMPVELHYDRWIGDRAIDFIERHESGPFFLFVSWPDPHHPFAPPRAYAERYDPAAMGLPAVDATDRASRPPYCDDLYPRGPFREAYWAADAGVEAGATISTDGIGESSLRAALAYTCAMIEMIDDEVGRVLRALESRGLADDTILLFTSDHGEYLGDHGLLHKGPASYRELTEIALLISGPGIRAGQRIDSLTSHIDLAPTLLELAGIDPGRVDFDGTSLTPVLSGATGAVREYTFGEYHPTVHQGLYNQTLYLDRWRYTIYPAWPEWGEMFDLEQDPGERVNRYFDAGQAVRRREFDDLLQREFPSRPTVDNPLLCKW